MRIIKINANNSSTCNVGNVGYIVYVVTRVDCTHVAVTKVHR